ncbi:MAG: T9SS type A sorting domain-containing protein, partial [Bacteroidales bacterium]
NSYSTAGTYYDSLTTAHGCDSVYVLHLQVHPVYDSLYPETICNKDMFSWRSNMYHLPGIYYDSLISSYGCDSVYVLELNVFYVDDSVSLQGITLTAHAVNAVFQWADCNAGYQPVSGATSASFTPSHDGDYAVIITQGGCSDTSACINVAGVGTEWQMKENGIEVYPNPGNGNFQLSLHEDAVVQVYNILGHPVYVKTLEKGTHILELEHLASGVYVLTARWNKQQTVIRLIIQK